ncbi:uncharacterized protein [Porites lutea]|uniref:uncharacterized protein n=1 Tax=Porites lutea TaxID=51062 RepID=UPI003CC5CA21
MSSSSALWLLLLWGNLLHYISGSAITRQERSVRGDIQTLDCDAIKRDPSKYLEMYWRVKGAYGNIGYCNKDRKCWKTESQLLEGKRIQVVSISSSNLTINRTLPQKTTAHNVTITCEVHTTDNKIHISEVKIESK